MSDLGHQSSSNGENPEVSSHKEISLDEIVTHIREFNSPVFSDDINSMST